MNRAELRTEVQGTGFGNTAADVIRQNHWLDIAYAYIWNAGEWSFKKVDQATLTVSSATPTMPSDFGHVDHIEDNFGRLLDELDPETFDAYFQPVPAVLTGLPWAYKVVNRQVTFGPAPAGTSTFKWSYTRRAAHLDGASATVAGPLAVDTDSPLWPADHHMVLVFGASTVGLGLVGGLAVTTLQGLRDDALEAMREDLEIELAPGQQWGSVWEGY